MRWLPEVVRRLGFQRLKILKSNHRVRKEKLSRESVKDKQPLSEEL